MDRSLSKKISLSTGHYMCRVALMLAILPVEFAYAQVPAWEPERFVELVVPSGPSGGNDKAARTLQKILQGQALISTPINVVNKPGGG